MDELRAKGIKDKDIIYINFESKEYSNIKNDDSRNVSKNTLYNYLKYMSRATLLNKVERYDVRGKRILSGKYKYT